MAASITFDFLTKGADRTASDFRKVGDNTVLAARGAKVLSDAIEKLGQKENRTAAESVLLAKALRQTGDAEDRVAARAVLADAAIRRMSDAMSDTSKQTGKAKGEVTGLAKALEGLKGKGGPAWLGPALLALPAVGTLSGVVAGAAAGIGGAFVAGGAALAAFGAVAKPVLTDAKTAATAAEKAQQAHAAAVAKVTGQYQYAMSIAKTKAQRDAAYAAEQKGFSSAGLAQTAALSKAYAGLSPAQIALSKQLGSMADAWDAVKASQTPVVAGALQPWLKSVTDLTRNLPPIIAKISPVIRGLGAQFDSLVNSSAFKGFRDFVGSTGAAAVSAGGSTIIDLIKSFMILLPQFDPLIREAVGWISRLGPAVLKWAGSKKAADDIQKFLQWFSANGSTVATFIGSLGRAIGSLLPGLTAGGALELTVLKNLLNWIGNLPKGLAATLGEIAGSLLILNKIPGGGKVITFAVKGAAGLLKWLTGGVINIGGGATAAAEMRAAFETGGTSAAAKMAAALESGGAVAAGEEGAGVAAAGAGVGKAASTSMLAALAASPGLPIIGGIIAGEIVKTVGDKLVKPGSTGAAASAGFKASGAPGATIFGGFVGKLAEILGIGGGSAAASVSKATDQITADFKRQGDAAKAARSDVDVLSAAITHNGNASGEAHAARAALISDMTKAGVNAATAQADVVNYSNAVTANGVQSDAARAARARLVGDILAASGNARQGKTDMNTYTTAVQEHGVKSDQARGARARLITDLTNTGLDAKTATGLVDGLGTSIRNLPSSKVIKIITEASGTGQIAITGSGWALGQGNIRFHAAAGAFIRAGSGPTADDVPAMLSKGELVVPANMVKAGAVDHLRGRVPGFAAGGLAGLGGQVDAVPGQAGTITGNLAGQAARTGVSQALAKAHAQVAARAAAQSQVGFAPGPAASGSALAAQNYAKSILWAFGWGPGQFPPLLSLWNQESGWNANAVNASSGAYGIPQALGHGHPYNLGDYANQVRWGLAYISGRYGSPSAAWAHEVANNWYSEGGLVPGYAAGGLVGMASGGTTTSGGPAAVTAYRNQLWKQRHGEGADYLGLLHAFAHDPAKYHSKYAESQLTSLGKKQGATQKAYTALAGPGLTKTHLDTLAAAAHAESLAAMHATTLRHPGWRSGLRYWLDRLSATAKQGLPGGQATSGPGGLGLPAITHTYGGDVADTIGAFLSSVAAPFSGARGGLVMDRGGWLRPGWNAPMYNATGRPEHLIPGPRGAAGPAAIIQIESSGNAFDQFMLAWMKKHAKIKGGGDVQAAFGSR